MLALAGCVQPALAPRINAAAARLLDRQDISLIEVPGAGCCGAVRFHLDGPGGGKDDMRSLIDAWWPMIERGEVEAIVLTASGLRILRARLSSSLPGRPGVPCEGEKDFRADERPFPRSCPRAPCRRGNPARWRFQSPCSLQHGQQVRGRAEALLRAAGYELTPVADGHLWLRFGGHLFPAAIRALRPPEGAQARRTGRRRARRGSRLYCDREYRLPHASAERNRDAGAALDRAAGVDFFDGNRA